MSVAACCSVVSVFWIRRCLISANSQQTCQAPYVCCCVLLCVTVYCQFVWYAGALLVATMSSASWLLQYEAACCRVLYCVVNSCDMQVPYLSPTVAQHVKHLMCCCCLNCCGVRIVWQRVAMCCERVWYPGAVLYESPNISLTSHNVCSTLQWVLWASSILVCLMSHQQSLEIAKSRAKLERGIFLTCNVICLSGCSCFWWSGWRGCGACRRGAGGVWHRALAWDHWGYHQGAGKHRYIYIYMLVYACSICTHTWICTCIDIYR